MKTLKTYGRILIISLLFILLLAACQPDGGEAVDVVEEDVKVSEGVKEEDVKADEGEIEVKRPDIVIAVQSINDTHDPTDTWNISIPILTNIYDQLVVRDFGESGLDAAAAPGLAESWTQTSDTVWEINLKQGVKFHNGEEMTAEDVAFSLASEERIAVDWGGMANSIEKAEAVDKSTVKVTTKFKNAAFQR